MADGAINDLIAGVEASGYVLRVPHEQHGAAITALNAAGYAVSAEADGLIAVSGEIDRGARVAYVLAVAGIYPDELRPPAVDLETAFLRVTGDDARNQAGGPA